MKVTGFSFLKNAVLYEYPIIEAITSILPLCDEFVIAIGKCDDGTLELIQQMNEDKIKIIETEWDDTLREGGRVLAEETNKALKHISEDTDWAFYIQADEVVHEKYLDVIRDAMIKYKDSPKVDGLLFKYEHFYGSFDYVGASSNWYPHEIRVIKNNTAIYSYRDAQGFRKNDDEKLNVIPIDAYVYHYGWVRKPDAMLRKQSNFSKLYNIEMDSQVVAKGEFDYEAHVTEIRPFEGTHPKVMQPRIDDQNWKFDYSIAMSKRSFKDALKSFLKKYLGWNMYYENYTILPKRNRGR